MTHKHMPNMVSVMTPFPYSIASADSIAAADAMMNEHGIHHLPVIDGGDIVGVLSSRDMLKAVRLGESVSDMHDILVSDVINHRPYMVDVSDPLPQVLRVMAEKHIGSVVVLKEGELVGIFTTNDALMKFASSLEDAFPANDPDDDAA